MMRYFLPLLLFLFTCSSVFAQQAILNIDKIDGSRSQYATSVIDSITYTVIPNVLPQVSDYNQDIPSGTSGGQGTIGHLNASDADGTIVNYEMTLSPSGLFYINNTTGYIFLNNGVDLTPYEGQTVAGTSTVTDNGGGQASGTITINIVP